MQIKKFIITSTMGAAIVIGSALPVFATGPGVNNCWGTVVSQRASYYHDIGEHSSSQTEPRVGVGNLAKELGPVFGVEGVGGLASVLGSLDDVVGQDPAGVTHCP